MVNPPSSLEAKARNDSPWKQKMGECAFLEERDFYLRKFKEIEHLCETWDLGRSSEQLIEQVRRIILFAPAVEWRIDNGDVVVDEAAGGSQLLSAGETL